MTKLSTRLLYALLSVPGLIGTAAAQINYTSLTVSGFNQDVIANGAGAVTTSTTSDMDNGAVTNRFCYVAPTFVSPTGATPPNSLPATGVIPNAVTPGNTYQLASYSAANSLRIADTGSGTLTLATPIPAAYVYLLGASGNGISTFTATVNFTDGTSQVFTGRTFADWFGGANPVIQSLGRVNYDSNVIQGGSVEPRMYEVPLNLLTTNYPKFVRSIGITKTSTLGSLNILAVNVGNVCPTAPAGGTAATSAATVCPGSSATLTLTGAAGGATISYQWQASTNGGTTWADVAGATALTLTVTPAAATQYRVRVQCGSFVGLSTVVAVAVATVASPTLTYGSATLCQAGTAAPTASPGGGTFTSTTGLVINANTGVINLPGSAAGSYVVTYTSAGPCPATATAAVTVVPVPVVALSFGSSTYCRSAPNPTPAATPAGGTFASTTGLIINANTGALNLAGSAPGTYVVTYTSAGLCPAAATATVTVAPVPTASVAFASSSYCQTAANPTPTFAPAGGTFSGPAGLAINANTGVINLTGSAPGTYVVTYTSPGPCPATATTSLTVAPVPMAAIALSGNTFCQSSANPVSVAVPVGGTFSGTPGLVVNAATGVITLAQSTPGQHTVTYTTAGPCPTQASTSLRIEATAAPVFHNVITPNNDNLNDQLIISLPSVTGYSMQVYNRWGRQVWESQDPSAHWAAEGNSAGTYYYLVRYADCSGQAQSNRGWVEVIK